MPYQDSMYNKIMEPQKQEIVLYIENAREMLTASRILFEVIQWLKKENWI
jgi:hypothetical protein